MVLPKKIEFGLVTRRVVVSCALLAGIAYGQVQESLPQETNSVDNGGPSDVIAKAAQDNPESVDFVHQIAQARMTQAIPMLEEKFARNQDPEAKGRIASALVILGDENDKYWEFLRKAAAPAVETDAPTVTRSDLQPGPSREFIAWAAAQHVTTEQALQTMYQLAISVGLLAATGDPRGIPLLRRALFSPYFLTQSFAAEGLAQIQDSASIPFIIEACQKSLPDARLVIAKSLIYFDDPSAQSAFNTYVPAEYAKALRETTVKGKLPFDN